MSVLLNRKICDNSPECSGIEVCPTGAIFWNSEEGMICLDNDLCISCGQCVDACPVGTFAVANNEDEYKEFESQFAADTRTAEELFVERYGAMPIDEDAVIDEKDLEFEIQNSVSKIILVEKFKDESIQCLLHSIPVEEILRGVDARYIKCFVDNNDGEEYPQLLIYVDGEKKGCITGYYVDDRTDELLDEINAILNK